MFYHLKIHNCFELAQSPLVILISPCSNRWISSSFFVVLFQDEKNCCKMWRKKLFFYKGEMKIVQLACEQELKDAKFLSFFPSSCVTVNSESLFTKTTGPYFLYLFLKFWNLLFFSIFWSNCCFFRKMLFLWGWSISTKIWKLAFPGPGHHSWTTFSEK